MAEIVKNNPAFKRIDKQFIAGMSLNLPLLYATITSIQNERILNFFGVLGIVGAGLIGYCFIKAITTQGSSRLNTTK